MHPNNGFILIGLPSMLQYCRAEVVVSSNSSKQLEAPPGMFGMHDCLMVQIHVNPQCPKKLDVVLSWYFLFLYLSFFECAGDLQRVLGIL